MDLDKLRGSEFAWCHNGTHKNGTLKFANTECKVETTWNKSAWMKVTSNMIRVYNVGTQGVHDLYFNKEATGFFCSQSGQRGYIEKEQSQYGGEAIYSYRSPDEANAPTEEIVHGQVFGKYKKALAGFKESGEIVKYMGGMKDSKLAHTCDVEVALSQEQKAECVLESLEKVFFSSSAVDPTLQLNETRTGEVHQTQDGEYDIDDGCISWMIDQPEAGTPNTNFEIVFKFKTEHVDAPLFSIDSPLEKGGHGERHIWLEGGIPHARIWPGEVFKCEDGFAMFSDGQWHKVKLTCMKGKTIKLYFDGKICAETQGEDESNFDWATGINIGKSSEVNGLLFTGQIKDFIYRGLPSPCCKDFLDKYLEEVNQMPHRNVFRRYCDEKFVLKVVNQMECYRKGEVEGGNQPQEYQKQGECRNWPLIKRQAAFAILCCTCREEDPKGYQLLQDCPKRFLWVQDKFVAIIKHQEERIAKEDDEEGEQYGEVHQETHFSRKLGQPTVKPVPEWLKNQQHQNDYPDPAAFLNQLNQGIYAADKNPDNILGAYGQNYDDYLGPQQYYNDDYGESEEEEAYVPNPNYVQPYLLKDSL